MKDQIVDTEGRPVNMGDATQAPEVYVADFDNTILPVTTAGGRMYMGLKKTELYAAQLFAQYFNPDDIDHPERVERLAARCKRGAEILANALRVAL